MNLPVIAVDGVAHRHPDSGEAARRVMRTVIEVILSVGALDDLGLPVFFSPPGPFALLGKDFSRRLPGFQVLRHPEIVTHAIVGAGKIVFAVVCKKVGISHPHGGLIFIGILGNKLLIFHIGNGFDPVQQNNQHRHPRQQQYTGGRADDSPFFLAHSRLLCARFSMCRPSGGTAGPLDIRLFRELSLTLAGLTFIHAQRPGPLPCGTGLRRQ